MIKHFGVILRVFFIALVLIFSISGCQNAANSDKWTEFTSSTIKKQRVKYDGKYSNPALSSYMLVDNTKKEIGLGNSEASATLIKLDAETFIATKKTTCQLQGSN